MMRIDDFGLHDSVVSMVSEEMMRLGADRSDMTCC